MQRDNDIQCCGLTCRATDLQALEAHLNSMSLKEINEKRETTSKYLIALNRSHNAQSPINKLTSDILYRIFAFAVFGSSVSATTTMYISHVCHHWRTSALGWGSLWGFVDLNFRQISALFLKRSQDAPITLACSIRYDPSESLFDHPTPRFRSLSLSMKKKYLESNVYLFSRLNALILHLSFTEFKEVRELFQNSGPLRLRSLDLGLYHFHTADYNDSDTIWSKYILIDTAYLRELRIQELSLPWTIPPHQKLTRLLIIHPLSLPPSIQLLKFLSHCPVLTELELDLSHDIPQHPDLQITTAAENVPTTFDKLDFPALTKLSLSAKDTQSYQYVREISSHLGVLGPLSSFWIKYDIPETETFPANILELVPNGVLSNFRHEQYLTINFLRSTLAGNFVSFGGDLGGIPRIQNQGSRFALEDILPFCLVRHGQPDQIFDHSPIVDLIRGTPEIRHLHLISSGWEVLTSWNIHFPSIFPQLAILELSDHSYPFRECDDCLSALADSSNLNLQTLILKRVAFNPSILLKVALKTGIKTLELGEDCFVEPEIINTLRGRGIRVISFDEELSTI